MHVHDAPVARFLAEHHRRARNERNAVAPRLWGRVPTDPFRLRVPIAPDDGEIVRYDAAEIEWRPIAAPNVRLIELPQPGPVLAALVSVTVQVEKDCHRCAAPDVLRGAPVEVGICLEIFAQAFQDARSIRL